MCSFIVTCINLLCVTFLVVQRCVCYREKPACKFNSAIQFGVGCSSGLPQPGGTPWAEPPLGPSRGAALPALPLPGQLGQHTGVSTEQRAEKFC